MGVVKQLPAKSYANVMEVLVSEEVERQLSQQQPRVLKYIKRSEVETFALNRLPALYASSEKGWKFQYEKASRQMYRQVADAVRQAIAAVLVDPIRTSQPLPVSMGGKESDVMLSQLRKALHQPQLTWKEVVRRLQQSGAAETEADMNAHSHRRPGTYGDGSWQPKRRPVQSPVQNASRSDFDWDDARYR
ncbi:MAG: late competence development ComFB family protein [Leptolyngbya sp. SIO4C1]|nr:late competence development ComFB family protein [Leptolyngbya sp. SIO4C1]